MTLLFLWQTKLNNIDPIVHNIFNLIIINLMLIVRRSLDLLFVGTKTKSLDGNITTNIIKIELKLNVN